MVADPPPSPLIEVLVLSPAITGRAEEQMSLPEAAGRTFP